MPEFPAANLKPLFATVFMGQFNKPSIEIQFESFSMEQRHQGETAIDNFDSPLRADHVEIPSADVLDLQGKAFDFPVNPESGYMDASIHFRHRHNPVDITRLEFRTLDNGYVPMKVVSHWLMSFEGTASNDFDYTFTVPVRV